MVSISLTLTRRCSVNGIVSDFEATVYVYDNINTHFKAQKPIENSLTSTTRTTGLPHHYSRFNGILPTSLGSSPEKRPAIPWSDLSLILNISSGTL